LIPLVFMHVFSFLSLSRSLSLWRLLSLQNCGDLLFEISFSPSEFKCEITFLWTMQEAGAERERERGSQIVPSPRTTRTRQMMTVTYIYIDIDIDISTLCLSVCPIASVRMYLFCLSYRVSAHKSVLWRACYLCRYSASRWHHSSIYSSYSFHSSRYSTCFHASVLSLSLSLCLASTVFVFMYLYSLSFSHKLQLFSCICALSLSLSTYSMTMMESARLCRLLFAISFSLSEFRCEITFL